MEKEDIKRARKQAAAADREEYFSRPGATPAGWRGGPHTVQKNRKKENDRKACRSWQE